MKKFKGHFSGPSHPSNPSTHSSVPFVHPSHPSHPSHQTRRFAPRRKGFHWTPEGHYGCLVDSLRFNCLKPNGCYTRSGVNIANGW